MRAAIGPAGQTPSCSPESSSTGPPMCSTGISVSEFTGISASARSYGTRGLDGDAPSGGLLNARKGSGRFPSVQAGFGVTSAPPPARRMLEAGQTLLLGPTTITALISGYCE